MTPPASAFFSVGLQIFFQRGPLGSIQPNIQNSSRAAFPHCCLSTVGVEFGPVLQVVRCGSEELQLGLIRLGRCSQRIVQLMVDDSHEHTRVCAAVVCCSHFSCLWFSSFASCFPHECCHVFPLQTRIASQRLRCPPRIPAGCFLKWAANPTSTWRWGFSVRVDACGVSPSLSRLK